MQKFHGAKVLSMDFLLPGTKVQRNEKARYPFYYIKFYLAGNWHEEAF